MKSFVIQTRHNTKGDLIPHLLDNGCDVELCSWKYLRQQKWTTQRKEQPTVLEYMDGRPSAKIYDITRQTMRFGPPGDRRTMTIDYLVCDINENIVLGLRWLKTVNPIIDWVKETWEWRDQKWPADIVRLRAVTEAYHAFKARQRIVQSRVEFNEPPSWVKRDFPDVIRETRAGELPPHRPGFDYEFTMKQGWKPRREKQRKFSPLERRMFQTLAEEETHHHRGWRWVTSRSPQAVQMLWAAKAGDEKRPCHDYRPINKWMESDVEPLPSIENILTQMSGYNYLTSIDLPKAYNQIRIADKSFTTEDGSRMTLQEALAFQCGDELYEPTVMQFGTKTAVQHFQRFLQHVLRDSWGKGAYAYLDNIIIGGDNHAELEKRERKALEALRKHSLTIKLKKTEWHKTRVLFCGFLIGGGKVVLDPAKLDAIRDWTLPWDRPEIPVGEKKTAVREFHGFCNFYADMVPRYASMAAPLTTLMAPLTPWKEGPSEREAFEEVKQALVGAVELTAFDEKAPKYAHFDAAHLGSISGCFAQLRNGKLEPLGFFSKKLSDTERRYSVTDQELMAIAKATSKRRGWLHGSPHQLQFYSDHAALKTLETNELSERNARWVAKLQEFNFIIRHIPGRENRAADALSRVGSHGDRMKKTGFTHPEWFAPSGVEADGLLGMNHKEIWRLYVEPILERHRCKCQGRTRHCGVCGRTNGRCWSCVRKKASECRHTGQGEAGLRRAWEKHKEEQTSSTLKSLVSLLILSSNIR